MASTGVRQDARQTERALQNLEKQIDSLKIKAPSELSLTPSSSYDDVEIKRIVAKVNEIIKALRR